MKNKLIEIGISSSFTDAPIGKYIQKWLSVFQIEPSIKFATYNQVFQELYDKNGVLSLIQNGIQILLVRFEDMIKDNCQSDEWKQNFLTEQLEQLQSAIMNNIGNNKRIVGILPTSEALLNTSMGSFIEMLNEKWLAFIHNNEHLIVMDMRNIARVQDMYNAYTNEIAHMPYQEKFYEIMGHTLARKISSFYKSPFKVIVLDCDNTLWNGICGEVGVKGIVIDQGRINFQNFLLDCFNKGMLLALASKNNEADVLEVFEQREDMVLKPPHFVKKKINWDHKFKNIREIAKELNLGLNSFIFIDDSKAECHEMMMNCPEVLTLKIPENSSQVMDFISKIWAFDVNEVSEDDRLRTKYYLEEDLRLASKTEDMSIEAYQESLNVKVYAYEAEETDIKRIAQLTKRTNQFNLTTRRMDEQEVIECLHHPKMQCKILEVEDKFGRYGVTGSLFVTEEDDALFVNLLLLSCRVLGRGVEQQLLGYFKKLCRQMNKNVIKADFYPTERNGQVKAFLENTGWTKEKTTELYERYVLVLDAIQEESKIIEERLEPVVMPEETHQERSLTIAQDIHHIGIAVRDIKKAINQYRKLGYVVGEYVKDELQDALLVMCEKENHMTVELIAPAHELSSINNYVKEEDYVPYHICIEVKSHEALYQILTQKGIQFDMISPPKKAILFNYKKVGFIYVKSFGLIEYIETEQFQDIKNRSRNVLQIVTSNRVEAQEVATLFGYTIHCGQIKNQHNQGMLQLMKKKQVDSKNFGYQLIEYVDEMNNNFENYDYNYAMDYDIFVVNEDQLLHKAYFEPVRYWFTLREEEAQMANEKDQDIEKIITDMAKQILEVDQINIEENFYKIGGNSFKLIKLLSQIYDNYHEEIPLVYAFEHLTVKSLCDYLKK